MYIFMINPKSGKGNAFIQWEKVKCLLDKERITYELHICNSNKETQQYMMEKISLSTIRAFVIIGGDGTISTVIQQLVHKEIPIAILPTGSGNDVCRNFNLVSNPKSFVEKLIHNECKTIDLLCINERYGITVAGIGLDAMIGKRADLSLYKKWLNKINLGSFAYTIAAVIELLTFKPFYGKLIVDNKPLLQTNLWLIANGNTKKYGGGMKICPSADPEDGWIHITALHDANRLKVLTKLFPILLQGKLVRHKEVTYSIGTDVVIQADKIVPYVIDGETFYADQIHITIEEKALKMIMTS